MEARVVIRLQGNLQWRTFRDQSCNQWIAVCDPLGLTVQAETFNNLMETISETLDGVFEELVETGDLDKFLKVQGWKLASPVPERRSGPISFDIPWEVIRQAANDRQANIH